MEELTQILGTPEVPHVKSELEQLAEAISFSRFPFIIDLNSLTEKGDAYLYHGTGKNTECEVKYNLRYKLGEPDGPVIPFEQAKQSLIEKRDKGEYEEQLDFYRGKDVSFAVIRKAQPKIENERYLVSFGGVVSVDGKFYTNKASLNLSQIKVLFEEAITCKFLKRAQK